MLRHRQYRNIRSLPFNHLLGRLDVEVFVGGLSENTREWPRHRLSEDPFWRLYLPISGSFRMIYPDACFTVRPGGIFLVPPRKPFQYESISPCTHCWVHFFSDQLASFPLLGSGVTELPVDPEQERKEFNTILDRLNSCSTMEDILELKSAVTRKLLPFLKQFADGTSSQDSPEVFAELLDYIDRNLDRDLEMEELFLHSGLSRAKLSALFHKSFQVSPKRYLLNRRISRARMLLLRTSLSIKEIAAQVGYENEFFFYRIFKKYTNLTPNTFRKRGFYE